MNFRFKGSLIPNAAVVSVTKDVILGGAATIKAGDIVTPDDSNPGYVKKGANGCTSAIATTCYWAAADSDETAAADGTVELLWCPSMVLEGTAATAGNLLQAVIDTRVTLDTSGATQKIDENDTTTGFMRILRPVGGAAKFDTTNGRNVEVCVNEPLN
jgi:hypothetical protein